MKLYLESGDYIVELTDYDGSSITNMRVAEASAPNTWYTFSSVALEAPNPSYDGAYIGTHDHKFVGFGANEAAWAGNNFICFAPTGLAAGQSITTDSLRLPSDWSYLIDQTGFVATDVKSELVYHLKGHWSFDNGDATADVGPDGTNSGATFVTDAGRTVASFEHGDYIQIDNAGVDFTTEDFTAAFWFYNDGASGDWGNLVGNLDTGSYGWGVTRYWGNDTLFTVQSGNGGSWSNPSHPSQFTIPLNTWTHVVLVRSGTQFKIYLDGVDSGYTATAHAAIAYTGDFLRIATHAYSPNETGIGKYDDVRIYSMALGADQVASLYTETTVSEPATPIQKNGYYPLYENESDANGHAGGNGTSHSHEFGGVTYYMPNGLTMGVDQFHGTYGQIAQYDLDSDAVDSIGSNDGTANNITFNTASGRSYAELNGTSSEVLLDQSVGDLWGSDASWSMWFKTSATAGAQDDFLYMARESYSGSSQSYFTVTLKTAGHIVAGLRSKSGSWATAPTWAETVVNDDQWHLVTFVREGTSLHLYIDGSLEGSLTNISGNFMSNVPVRIGSYSSGSGSPSRWFDGQIDDMRMWDRALDADEVAYWYAETVQLGDGLVAKWLFDGDLQDETGNHNALSPTGVETYVANGGNEWFDHPGNGTDYVSVPYNEDLVPTDAITVSTWIKYRDSLGNHYDNFIMANGTNADPYGSQLSWLIGRIRQDEGPLAHLAPMDNSGKFYFQIQTENGYTAAVDHQGDENSPATIETERWYHIVGTYDGSMVRIYTDGVLTGQYAQTGQIVRHPGQPITMNYHVIPELTAPGNAPGQAALSQDDTRIWNRALAAGEITSLYNETNLYSNEGETPQGENTMDAIYIKIAGSLADAFPTEPKMRLFDASGTEVTTGEVGFLGAEDDELVFFMPPSNMSPTGAFAGYYAEIYDGFGDGMMKPPVGAMTYEIGYYVASSNTYASVATTAVPSNEEVAMVTDAFRNRDHVVLEFSWDYNGGSPTASFASTQLFTGPWPTGTVAVSVSPMKIRSNEQINHGFNVGGTFYPNVDAMAAAGVYTAGSISDNASIGSLGAWIVPHTYATYQAFPTSQMLVNMAMLSEQAADLLTIAGTEDANIRNEFALADSAIQSHLDSVVLDLDAETAARSLTDSNLSVDIADLAQDLIDEEAVRSIKDAALDDEISVLNSELDQGLVDLETQFTDEDSVLKSDLEAQLGVEEQARIDGDSILKSDLDATIVSASNAYIAADSVLKSDLEDQLGVEAQARIDGDSVIKSDLDAQIVAVENDVDSEHSLIRSELAAEIDGLVDGAPALLDTLNEIAAAINDDANFATTMTTALTNATNDRGAIRSEFAAADSVVKSDLEDQLGVEEQARIDGDSVLKSDLDASIVTASNAYIAADSVLKSDLEDQLGVEEQARIDGDSVVKSDLDAQMAQEVSDRSNADNLATTDRADIRTEFADADSVMKSDLEAQVGVEEQARIDGDSVTKSDLEAQLGVEEQARIDGDSVLKSDLDASIVTASNAYIAADSVLKSDLEAQLGVEEQARIDGDSVVKSDLEAQLGVEEQARLDGDSVVKSDLEAQLGVEAQTRIDEDSILKSDLDAQILAVENDVDSEHSLIRSELAAEIDGLVDGAPALLDTLNEIAAAINDDANFATTMTTALTNATNDRGAIRTEFADADSELKSDLEAQLGVEEQARIDGDSILKSDLDASLATASNAYIAADSVIKSDLEAQVSDLEGRAQADFAQMYDFNRKDGDTLVATLVAGTMFPLSQDASYIKFVTLNGLVISEAEFTAVLNGGGTAFQGITFAYDLSAGDTFVVHYNKVVSFSV